MLINKSLTTNRLQCIWIVCSFFSYSWDSIKHFTYIPYVRTTTNGEYTSHYSKGRTMETWRDVLLDHGIIIVLVEGHKDSARWIYHGCMAVFNRIARHKDQHGASSFVLRSRKTLSFVTNLLLNFRRLCTGSSFILYFFQDEMKMARRTVHWWSTKNRGWWYSAPVSKRAVSKRRRDKRLKSPLHFRMTFKVNHVK